MQKFGFFLVPGYSLVALSCAVDVLRAANLEAQAVNFEWVLLGDDCSAVASSSGIELPCISINNNAVFDVVVVCGGERSHMYHSKKVDTWLREHARKGSNIGSISDGAYVVAKIGLFDNCRSTIHWKCQSAYRELYPSLDIRMSIFEIDGKRFSCVGGTASLDLLLNFVSKKLGVEIAGRVADNYFHDTIRGEDQTQHMTGALRFAGSNKKLTKALLLMEAAIEFPMPINEIADEVNISQRQLDRIFQEYLKTSPSKYYREMRLLRAGEMLRQTNVPISQIALGCGFQSVTHFSKYFKQQFNDTPRKYRHRS